MRTRRVPGLSAFYKHCITENPNGLILDGEILIRYGDAIAFNKTTIRLNAPWGGGFRAAGNNA
jgi:hypothetical protein